MNSRRTLIAAVTSLVCALALSACGSAAKKPKTSKPGGPFMAFSVCMRSHGVPDFPDPAAGGGGIHLAAGINVNSPSFKSAQTKCFHVLPGGGPGAQKASKQEIAQAVKTSECMRTHGVSGFPDPISQLPNDPQNYSQIGDRGGVIIAIPNTIDAASPVFQHAAKVCGFSG
jgi:hypothetical protein